MKLLHVRVADDVCAQLQRAAELSGRTLHDELVVRLGGTPVPPRPIEEVLADIDAFRESLGRSFDHTLIDQFIEEGRP
ncbi:hypothetical protein [Longimicrobium terrae]|uniref:Antitoxin n=1 Tax=Longimicrobium terrae TaxID=1639882 RepID=A0A841H676_9BACT|nr:hypothetical protein [Longimicrobium terrae]MBB4639152.1 hypothetical protein [Longimicrobium terrae]MBB6073444.1 hypothetical protein [Longimicrobium terrae]NNC32568.1 hypothetical protein [Longimicrobium terrae]